MRVYVNGTETAVGDGLSLERLLADLNIATDRKGIAVAVNDTVKPRSAWPATTIRENDRIEIVRAVQGG
jgi:sulfur carrier protein